ncbi:MAG: glycosyltransferase family 4 protein [Planctomycetota bacterium]|nr:glycosyltransferase family 4 protein [Planctomycetota bacterium]
MKIAFVIINANRREGTSRAVVEVAERLARNHHVTVFARTAESLNTTLVKWVHVPAPSWPDVAEFEGFRILAERQIKNRDFDIIHSAGCNVWNADVYAIQTVHPEKMRVNELQIRDKGIGLARKFTRWLYDVLVIRSERKAYRVTNSRGSVGYLPVSSGTQRELTDWYSLEKSLIEVVPNGADLNFFHPDLRLTHRDAVRAELDCNSHQIVFLFAGGEWNRKGLALAIESLAKLPNKQAVLWIAGADPQKNVFESMVHRLGLQEQVRWLGFRKDIERVYSAADVFLFPSAYEAFSLATIEAAACGLPVIMCDISGAHELLGDGHGGRIVERSSDAIAKAMHELTDDPKLLCEEGKLARMKVEAHFHWDAIAQQTEDFYVKLLQYRKQKTA